MFESRDGAAHFVDAKTLSRLLRAGTFDRLTFSPSSLLLLISVWSRSGLQRLRLVFVASCYSLGVGEAFLKAGQKPCLE